mgnify:CR=1 FL=1
MPSPSRKRKPRTEVVLAKKNVMARRKPRLLPPWKVLLHNDDVNERDYVVETIQMLTPLSMSEASTRMKEARNGGVALLLTTHQERAELYIEQFSSRNLTVTAEPA